MRGFAGGTAPPTTDVDTSIYKSLDIYPVDSYLRSILTAPSPSLGDGPPRNPLWSIERSSPSLGDGPPLDDLHLESYIYCKNVASNTY